MFKMQKKKLLCNSLIVIIIIIGLIGSASSSSAQLFSQTDEITTVIDETNSAIFIGDISFQGSFQGVSLDSFIDSLSDYFDLLDSTIFPEDLQYFSSWDNLYGFPVFSETIIENVNAFEINITELSDLDDGSFGDILTIAQSILSYQQVDVRINNGIGLIGSDQQDYSVDHGASYGIGGLFNFDLSEDFPSSGLGVLSDQRSEFGSDTEGWFIYPLESSIDIVENGNSIRTIDQTDTILLVKTSDNPHVYQDSMFHFFPLLDGLDAKALFSLKVSESDSAEADLMNLFNDLESSFVMEEDNPFGDFLSFDEGFNSVIPLVSQVLNSGFILINTTEPIIINEKNTADVSIAVSRGPLYTMDVDQQSSSPVRITGSSSLLFINDHLYTESAEISDNGVSFPLWSIALWIIALGSIIFYYLLKTKRINLNVNVKNTSNIGFFENKLIRFTLPIFVFLILFFLVDLSFSMRIGLSFLGLLAVQSNAIILVIFLLVEFVVLLIMFLMYALPSRLIHDIVCKTFIENKYQRISKAVVMIAVFWVGIQLYVLVLFNIILSFIPLSSMIPIG